MVIRMNRLSTTLFALSLTAAIGMCGAAQAANGKDAGRGFPDCPAPAVNDVSVRQGISDGAPVISVFVVVQNVGNRGFRTAAGGATLEVTLGNQRLETFTVPTLQASEVQHFMVRAAVEPSNLTDKINARLVFSDPSRTGPIADTLDCQTDDNLRVAPLEAALAIHAGS